MQHEAPRRVGHRPPVWPHLVALALIAATLVVGLLAYPAAPDPMPVHFDAAMQPDAWAAKSLGGFLLPVIIGVAVVAVFWIVAVFAPLDGGHRTSADDAASTTSDQPRVQLSPRPKTSDAAVEATTRMLGTLTIATSGLISVTALTTWLGVPAWLTPWVLPVLLAVFFGLLARSCIQVFRAQHGSA